MKGKTIIELTDINTKEVKRIEDHNMFTKALDSVFNQIPWWHSNTAVREANTSGGLNTLVPIIGRALGGLLLFPETIDENADTIFAPASNKPTAIAAYDAYTGDDTRRGSFNNIESGNTSNGYRFVWDFATSAGNGAIKCACLTSHRGGSGYLDGGTNLLKDTASGDFYIPVGSRYILDYKTNCFPFGADDKGIYFKTGTEICRIKTPRKSFNLFGSPTSYETLGYVTDGGALLHDGKVCIIRNSANSSGNATVNIDKYDPETWEKTTETITVAAPLAASHANRYTCVSNGYLYLLANDAKSYYKVKLDNLADVQQIVLPSTASTARGGSLTAFNNGAIGRYFLLEEDNTAHKTGFTNSVPFAVDGAWVLVAPEEIGLNRTQLYIGSTVIMPYIATINNLAQPVNKGATQTMKVTYIVTE